jgi:hypothetical protein
MTMTTDGPRPHEERDRRKRSLSDCDIDAIVAAIVAHDHSMCKFDGVTRDDLLEAVRFYKNFNDTVNSSKKTVLNAFLIMLITSLISLTAFGAFMKLGGKGQ